MKLLIAAGGTSLESPVESRFEHAVWYLLFNAKTGDMEVYQNLPPHDHHTILVTASQAHVSAVVTGWVSPATAKLMQSLNLRLAVAHNLRIRDVLTRLSRGELPFADVTTYRQGLVVPGLVSPGSPALMKKRLKNTAGMVSPRNTPRGQHHLQQYGGRGH